MKNILFISLVIITISCINNKAEVVDAPNIINQFIITADKSDSSKFFFSPRAIFYNNNIYFLFDSDNKYKILSYSLNGEKLGQNKLEANPYMYKQIDCNEDTISLHLFFGENDTIYYYKYVYSHNLQNFNEISQTTYFNGYIDSYTSQIPRKDSLLYFLIFSFNKNNMSLYEYHIITTDLNYQIKKIIDLDNTNIDADQFQGGTPIYCLDNGHFTFRLFKSKDGNPFKTDEYMYEYDFSGKYYSKKLIENKIVLDNDTFNVKGYAVEKMKDFSTIVFTKLSNSNKKISCLIKYASNGEIKWISPIDDYNDNFDAISIKYIDNQQTIALYGRFYPDGNNKNPYGSYLELFDKDGNHLETYTWQRNKYLDCTVFNVLEGPGNHLLVITKNGSDSLIVSEIIPKYVSAKENSVLFKNINLSPNPAYSTTRVNLQQEGQVAITAVDLLGRSFLLWSGYASTGDMELDISTLPTGSYTLLIDYGTKREAVRMMKE